MLSTFPSLLLYSFFVPTLLRMVVGVFLLMIAAHNVGKRHIIAGTTLPVLGKPGEWLVWVSVVLTGLVGYLLIAGAYTQLAALGAAVVAIKYLFLPKNLRPLVPFSRSTYVLLFFIALSLLVLGAGADAFDLPL